MSESLCANQLGLSPSKMDEIVLPLWVITLYSDFACAAHAMSSTKHTKGHFTLDLRRDKHALLYLVKLVILPICAMTKLMHSMHSPLFVTAINVDNSQN